MSNRAVTILIAIYKAGDYIKAKIDNLLQQTILDQCNIMLLNCQNLHNERGVYAELLDRPNFYEIAYNDHIQLYPTWNDGITNSQSTYICNSNVDDMWHPEYLQTCVAYLDRNPDVACVSSGIYITQRPNQANHENWKNDGQFPLLPYPHSSAGPCPVWRRSLHDKYGYFGGYHVIGDARMWELWLAGGEQFHVIPKQLVLYYAHSESLERRHHEQTGVLLRDLDIEYDRLNQEIQNGTQENPSQELKEAADHSESPTGQEGTASGANHQAIQTNQNNP